MASICRNCGQEIDGNSPICMHCGVAISEGEMTQEAKERMQKDAQKSSSSNTGTSLKAFGAMLIIIGILVDIVSMFLIFSSDFGAFGVLTIIGTIAFIIGLAIVANS